MVEPHQDEADRGDEAARPVHGQRREILGHRVEPERRVGPETAADHLVGVGEELPGPALERHDAAEGERAAHRGQGEARPAERRSDHVEGDRARGGRHQAPPHERPHPQADPGEHERGEAAQPARAEADQGLAPEVEALLEPGARQRLEHQEQELQREHAQDRHQDRLGEERGHQRRARDEDEHAEQVDPDHHAEHLAAESLVRRQLLHEHHVEAQVVQQIEHGGEDHRHRQDAVVGRREQADDHDRHHPGNHLAEKPGGGRPAQRVQDLGSNRDGGGTHPSRLPDPDFSDQRHRARGGRPERPPGSGGPRRPRTCLRRNSPRCR